MKIKVICNNCRKNSGQWTVKAKAFTGMKGIKAIIHWLLMLLWLLKQDIDYGLEELPEYFSLILLIL